MKVERVNETNRDIVLDFLRKVNTIKNINPEIVDNASIVINDDVVEAIISYEEFSKYGLIRYFVFRKSLTTDILFDMFNHLIKRVKNEQIESLVSLVNRDEVMELFTSLGFQEVDKEYLFIEEKNIQESDFKDTRVVKLDII